MSTINLNELNQFVKNYYDQIGLSDLEAHHAGRIREWFKDNLSLIGVYAHRDAGRFGNFKSENEDDNHFGRADGWVSLTEEVPDIDHLTYGTGVLYVHGEMEIPENEDGLAVPKDNIFGDEFYHVDKTGATKHIYEDVVNPERFIDWNSSTNDLRSTYATAYRAAGYADTRGQPSQDKYVGYVWEEEEETHTGTIGDDRWLYEHVTDVSGGVYLDEKLAAPSGNGETPTVFNDEEVYNIDNDRHHYPWIVINSAQVKSVQTFLQDYWEGQNGMYDSDLPELAVQVGTYPPVVHGGIKYVKSGVDGILDYVSPLDEVP